jgi:hypothetical protein
MRDGALICIGKGNDDWNQSAPHGAGWLMSCSEAKNSISMKEYRESMTGVYTTSVNKGTLDESPMAYKLMEEIVRNIEPTAEIVSHIRPIYNFKAGAEELFKQIGIAFYVLSDPQSREEYDRQMHFREEIKAPTGLLNLQQNMRESPQSLRSRHQRAQ